MQTEINGSADIKGSRAHHQKKPTGLNLNCILKKGTKYNALGKSISIAWALKV